MSEAKPSRSREKSRSRSKNAAKSAKVPKAKADVGLDAPVKATAEKPASPYPVFDLSEAPASPPAVPEEIAPTADWPEPEPASSGDAAAPENPKRKRRRKKGKGGSQQTVSLAPPGDETPAAVTRDSAPTPHQSLPRPKLDAESVSKLAWKIYLAEVSEEGVALIGDNDAKELSRRCFRLAEIFVEEQARRR
jgi:hypothetical protein